ncbi:MAG: glycosyltransferase [Actinomycetaceae bacterium]|nr:glycosyltransferase [Actinomycetaceae bacterium]
MAEPTVTALVVTRGATPFLERTLAGLKSQSLLPDQVRIINVDGQSVPGGEGVPVIHIPKVPNLGQAIRVAVDANPELLSSDWLWILHDDSAPASGCLKALLTTGEEGRTIGIVGPKQVAWSDPHRLLEVGIHASRSGRRLEMLSPHEIDQGQHDDIADVIAVGTAGMLIRTDVWKYTEGTDPALGPFGDGLELGRRVRLAGYRVVLAPNARVAHARGSYRDVRERSRPDISRSFAARRVAQSYNGALAAPFPALLAYLVLLPLLAIVRSVVRVFGKRVDLGIAELVAALAFYGRIGKLIRGRRRISRQQRVPVAALRALEISHHEINQAKRALARREREPRMIETIEPVAARLLLTHRAHANIVLALGALTTTILSLTVGRGLNGGIIGPAWVNLPDRYAELWAQAWGGWIAGGAGNPGPPEPLLTIFAILTAPFALVGISPNTVLVTLWILAPALTWISMYLGAHALTNRVSWRAIFATVWLGATVFHVSWSEGRIGAVLVHTVAPLLLLGWARACGLAPVLRIRGARSQETRVRQTTMTASYAGLASIAALVVVASAPWTIVVIGSGAVVLTVVSKSRRWTPILTTLPAIAFLIPTWIAVFQQGSTRSLRLLLADSGQPYRFLAAETWHTLLGLPQAISFQPLTDWTGAIAYAPVLPGALALIGATIALFNTKTHVLRTRIAYLGAIVAFAVAVVASRTAVYFDQGFIAAWPGPALSIALLGLIVAWSGAVGGLILEESVRSYAARRRIEKAQQKKHRKERSDNESDTDGTQPQDVVAAIDAETGHHVGTRIGISRAERVLVPVISLLTLIAFVAPALTIAEWLPRAAFDDGTIGRAPAHLTPAAAAQAQHSDRRARLLRLTVDESATTLYLYRGDGRQLADSSPTQRLALAVDVQYSQIDRRYDLLTASDPVTSELALLATRMLYTPETDMSEQFRSFALDQIILTDGDSAEYTRAKAALDRNPALQRAGTSDTGLLWRVIDGDTGPARLILKHDEGRTALPSGIIGAQIHLDDYDISPGMLVLSERANTHWRATIDGQPLVPMNDGWRQAFELPTTSGTLRIRFQPDWLIPWWVASATSFAGALIASLPMRRRVRVND